MNPFPKWKLPIAALLVGFSIGISRHILPVVFPSMRSMAGVMNYQLGLLTSTYYFSYMIFAWVFGSLSDQLNGRLLISTCCLLISFGSFGMGFSSQNASLLAFSVVSGIGAGGLYVPMVSLLLKKTVHQKGFLTSLVLTGEGLSGITIGIVVPNMVAFLDWRSVWWLFGFIALFFGGYLWFAIGRPPPEAAASSRPRFDLAVWHQMKSKTLWVLGGIYFSHAITRGVFVTFFVAYLVRSGWSFPDASHAFSFIAIGFIPGASLTGLLADRFNNRSVLLALMTLQIVCVGAVLIHPSHITILVFSLTEGFCIAGIPTLMGILPVLYFSKDIYGKVFGLLTLAFGLGVSVSPLLGGILGDLTHSLSSPYLLGLAASLISLGMILFLLKQSAFSEH